MTVITSSRVFKLISPLSKYLQISGLDILQALRTVDTTTKKLNLLGKDFQKILEKISWFVKVFNGKLWSLDINFKLKVNLPSKRIRKRKSPFDNSENRTIFTNFCKEFKVNVHNFIMGKTISGIKSWFQKHRELYRVFLCLDPPRFPEFKMVFWKKMCDCLCKHLQYHIEISASTLHSSSPKTYQGITRRTW